MSLIAKIAPDYSPPGWREYEKRVSVAGATPMFARAALVNRFYARYRLALAFRGLMLEGYSPQTIAGYDALTKVSLHWSAFEQLTRAILITDTRKLAERYNYDSCLSDIRKADPDAKFFGFVHEHLVDGPLKNAVATFMAGNACNSLVLAKAVRHIFFHGPLTANARGLTPDAVTVICDALSKSLVEVMDGEFKLRVDDLMVAYP